MIQYTQTELRVMAVGSGIGGVASYLMGGIDCMVIALFALVCIDYFTGMYAAGKTCTLSSKRGFNGIMRKVIIFVIVVVAAQVDSALGVPLFRGAVILGYIGNEGLSILENIDRMGYGEHIPQFLRDKLCQLKTEKEGKNNG